MTTTTDEFRKQMEQADMSYPDAWEPSEGDILIARVDSYDKANTRYGEQYVCNCTREDDGEQVAVWLSHTVLLEAFKRERPAPGERIGIRFHGEHPEKGYAQYTLRVDRDGDDAVPDFDRSDPPRDQAAVNAADGVADEVEQQRQQQADGGDDVELAENDENRKIPF